MKSLGATLQYTRYGKFDAGVPKGDNLGFTFLSCFLLWVILIWALCKVYFLQAGCLKFVLQCNKNQYVVLYKKYVCVYMCACVRRNTFMEVRGQHLHVGAYGGQKDTLDPLETDL